jgi:hypothetical protein
MADRPLLLEGRNPVLALVVALLWLATAILFAGPGRTAIAAARQEVAKLEARSESWARKYHRNENLPEAKRLAWSTGYERMRSFGAPSQEGPRLTAWVADVLRAPSVRGLEVTLDPATEAGESRSFQLSAPAGESQAPSIRLTVLPIRVRFDARFEDVAWLIAQLESPDSALELRRVQLQRHLPEVRVELDLDVWTHEELDS